MTTTANLYICTHPVPLAPFDQQNNNVQMNRGEKPNGGDEEGKNDAAFNHTVTQCCTGNQKGREEEKEGWGVILPPPYTTIR